MADEKEFMKFKPEHPLPEEVRKMNRDETVCKFCGVSYLIHNEIKALEDKVKALEEQLIHFQGSEKREEDLRNQLNVVNSEKQKLQDALTGKEAVLNTLRVEMSSKTEELNQVESSRKQIAEKLQYMSVACEQYKLKHGLLCANLPTVQAALSQQKAVLSALREDILRKDQLFVQESQGLAKSVEVVCTGQIAESVSMRAKLHDLENERLSFKFKEEKYVSELKNAERQLNCLESTVQDVDQLSQKCKELEHTNSGLEKDLSSQQEQFRQISLQSRQYQDQLKQYTEQMEQQRSLARNKDLMAEQNRAKLEKDVKDKDTELQTVLRELGRMKAKVVEQQEEIQKKTSLSSMRSQEMSEQLERCHGDLEALKQERELMITAHQDQIEQLRESFKKKVADTDKWQEKLDEMLQKERNKHKNELSVIEQKLKENFVYELQIEKQKLQEIHEKRLSGLREEEETLRNKLGNIENKHRSEVSELHKQLATNKARSREVENTLRQEIVSLKKIIADLEQRLGRLDSGSDQKVVELKAEVKKLQSELGETREESGKLQNQLTTAKEEIGFLQETVRRECEERFELTETLSQMKEDLLQYKRPPGGYSQASMRSMSSSVQPKSPDQTSVTSPSSEEIMLFRKVSRPQPTPPSSSHKDSSVEHQDLTSASSIQLGYGGETARTGGGTTGRGIKGGSLKDSRRRIAEAVGRK